MKRKPKKDKLFQKTRKLLQEAKEMISRHPDPNFQSLIKEMELSIQEGKKAQIRKIYKRLKKFFVLKKAAILTSKLRDKIANQKNLLRCKNAQYHYKNEDMRYSWIRKMENLVYNLNFYIDTDDIEKLQKTIEEAENLLRTISTKNKEFHDDV